MKKRVITIGLACLTAGIGLAGCAGSNEQPTEATTTAETTTVAETTTTTETETTTTTEETTTVTEAWRSKYESALIQPQKNPEEAWGDKYKVELRLNNGVHLYLPSFFDDFIDGQEGAAPGYFGVLGYFMIAGDNNIDFYKYGKYDEATNTMHKGEDYFELNQNNIEVKVEDGVVFISCETANEMPQDEGEHKYKKIGEADGEVYYIDFTPLDYGWVSFPDNPDAAPLDYFNKYADLIAETAWVEKIEKTETKAHPEDDRIMENLRAFYKSHEIVDGVPATENGAKYAKYAIADFDGDGQNEVVVETAFDYFGDIAHVLEMYNNDQSIDDKPDRSASFKSFSNITFLDNGVAYMVASGENDSAYRNIDKKYYYIMSDKVLEKLNYNLNNFYDYDSTFILSYSNHDGRIMKSLGSGQDIYFDPVEKTQAEYEADMAILNSGKELDFQVKDFTAENIGL